MSAWYTKVRLVRRSHKVEFYKDSTSSGYEENTNVKLNERTRSQNTVVSQQIFLIFINFSLP